MKQLKDILIRLNTLAIPVAGLLGLMLGLMVGMSAGEESAQSERIFFAIFFSTLGLLALPLLYILVSAIVSWIIVGKFRLYLDPNLTAWFRRNFPGRSSPISDRVRATEHYRAAWAKYAIFSGRSPRKEYWYFYLFNFLIMAGLRILDGVLFGADLQIFSSIFQLAALIPGFAVSIRRMHDVGKSGWFILVPIYNLILAVTDSVPGSNRYGADPKPVLQRESKAA